MAAVPPHTYTQAQMLDRDVPMTSKCLPANADTRPRVVELQHSILVFGRIPGLTVITASQKGMNVIERNKKYFDSVAATYDTKPQAIELARRLSSLFRKVYPFDEESTEVLDYACGTGLISQHLTAYAKSITGLDISSGMTNRYNERVENQGLEPENMRAICIDPDDDLREFEATFDVAVCAASYHHFPSIEETTLKLARTMRPGGVLMVADLVKVDGTEDLYPEHALTWTGDASLVCHQGGIAEADIRRVFGEAGLSNLRYSVHDIAAKRKGQPVEFFLMTGRKA